MRHLGRLLGLSMIALALGTPVAAQADPGINANLVDGSVTVSTVSCSWVNGSTTDNPPNPLTILASTVNPNLVCSGASGVKLNNNPNVTFDDVAGTATVDRLSVTGTSTGITCTYEVTGAVLTRQGTGRTYTGSGYTARKTGGSFLCPSTASGASASLTFH